MTDLADRVKPGATFAVRVTPKASRDRIDCETDPLRVHVTAPPEDGKANEAVRKLLARCLGIAKTRLTLVRGQTSRDKIFRVD
jgi:uncharacterized protein (TIGR00251 family)